MGDGRYRDENLDKETYEYLISILDKKHIAEAIFKIYPEAELKTHQVKWKSQGEVELSDIEIARQYYHWYLLDSEIVI